jgi:hypothetical protein
MYIYKITVLPINQVYIGFDSSPSYKLKRWGIHCKNASTESLIKLHREMGNYGIENCTVEVLDDNYRTIIDLALAEIMYVKEYDSYRNGLNSSAGGDGIGRHDLAKLSEADINLIKSALGESFRDYNVNVKWKDKTPEERKELTKHLHTPEIYKKKSDTLKKFYEANPEMKKVKMDGLKDWRSKNKETVKANCKKNGMKGAAKVSIKMKVETEDGTIMQFDSKSDFNRKTGQWAKTVIDKTKDGSFYNGYRIRR